MRAWASLVLGATVVFVFAACANRADDDVESTPPTAAITQAATHGNGGGPGNPSAPKCQDRGELTASSVTATSVTLTWSGAHGGGGITQYEVFENGSVLATVDGSTSSYVVTGLTASTAYAFSVQAGNRVNAF